MRSMANDQANTETVGPANSTGMGSSKTFAGMNFSARKPCAFELEYA